MNAEATAVRDTKPIGRAIPGRWSAAPSDGAIRAVVSLGLIPVRVLGTRLGRRLAATVVLSLLVVGGVSALYDHADTPGTLLAVSAAASKPTTARQGASAAKGAASGETSLAAVAASRPARDPGSAAVAWYAKRVRVSPDHVQALQQQRVDGVTTRILVMAEVSQTKMATAFVTVKRAGGGWKVP